LEKIHKALIAAALFSCYAKPVKLSGLPAQNYAPHSLGHSHNDEMQARPLQQALQDGFNNVEVDVHLVDGRLLVGHDLSDAKAKNLTLEKAYLDPLCQRVEEHGAVHANGPEFTLCIDLKSSADSTYRALQSTLKNYDSVLVKVVGGQLQSAPIRVVLTGNRPKIETQADRMVFLDAQLHEVLKDPDQIDPLVHSTVSGNYRMFFRWNGKGEMPAKEQQRLRTMAEDMEQLGLRMRLWDAPDQPEAWKAFAHNGVDLINTDHLDQFAAWHQQRFSCR